MIIFGIDPGPVRSAWVLYDATAKEVRGAHIESNADVLFRLRVDHAIGPSERFVIEMIECMGMPVGREVFETCVWIGRFTEALGGDVTRLSRRQVKLHLCGTCRAKDANVRRVLLDRFGGDGACGTKRKPGPLYGVKRDLWSALALAVTYTEQNERDIV